MTDTQVAPVDAQQIDGWIISLQMAPTAVPFFQSALDQLQASVAAFEVIEFELWQVDAYCSDMPDQGQLIALLCAATAAANLTDIPEITTTPLYRRDWVSENQASFKPIHAGRYYIHGSHITDIPAATIPLRIDAGTAFGTGEHETTRGCLLGLTELAKKQKFHRILDMGCGTAILAMAAAKTFRRPVIASDIDEKSVIMAQKNVAENGLSTYVRTLCGPGYQSPKIRRRNRYDLVFANILARPLCQMAPDLAHVLAPNGYAVLSGLLNWQEQRVLSAHRQVGLNLVKRIPLGQWHTLILRKSPPVQDQSYYDSY